MTRFDRLAYGVLFWTLCMVCCVLGLAAGAYLAIVVFGTI